jgi:hypothetical protein
MFHGRNNLAHGPHNPNDFLATVVRLRFVTASRYAKPSFSIGLARVRDADKFSISSIRISFLNDVYVIIIATREIKFVII